MMPTTPRLLRHATVTTTGVGDASASPTPGIRQIVCQNVRIACIHNGIDRKQLALMLGVSYPTISGIWHHTRNISTEDLWTIAEACEIPVYRFFDYHDINDWDWLYDDRRRLEARQAVVRSLHELAAQLEDYSEKETHNG